MTPTNKIKKFLFFITIVLVLGIYFCGNRIWLFFMTDGYQAVFLTNGQVYFGKLDMDGKWLKLSDIYYLKAMESLQQTNSPREDDPNQNIQLVKLGNELHGPTDNMYLARDQILFWENMKEDSRVLKAIKEYQSKAP